MANNDTTQDDADVFHDTVTRGSDAVINRVAIKIPPFWTEHPELWLSQIEAQFVLASILASIEAPVLARIANAIINQPGTGKYEKSCILERFCESEQKKIQKLISETDLDDKRPTQLLNELNALAANNVVEIFLKSLWLQRQPTQVQAILQLSDACLADLAKLADKEMEVGDFHHICTVDAKSAPSSSRFRRTSRLHGAKINALFKIPYLRIATASRLKACSSDSADKFDEDHNTMARLAINENSSKTQFFINTGAGISGMPPCRISKTMLTPKLLFTANGTKIQTYGEKRITLSLGFFISTFLLADVKCAIIGADFIQHFDLLVDMKRRKHIDRAMLHELTCQRKINAILSYDTSNQYARLLHDYHDLATINSNRLPAKSEVTNFIPTNAHYHAHARRLAPDKLKAAQTEFSYLIKKGICRPSKSNLSSPLHLVKKANEEWRPCGDYRVLNNVTVPNRHPIPYILDVTSILHGKKIFSKIGLQKAYQPIPVEPKDIPKTAIITPFGLFEFLFMTFNLRNTVQSFQHHINKVQLEPESRSLKKNEVHPICKLQYLLYRRITAEEPHKRNGPEQCPICQEYGHTRSYCTHRAASVVCGDAHSSTQCTINKDSIVKKCGNYGGNHTANYKGCMVYKDLKSRMRQATATPKKHQKLRQTSSSPKLRGPHSVP
ncbi:uncharacterized protein LOC123258266 [Drosophila ananassae]|uniref:uncharacterized protein LOC123258266 n=1 Tax=Drosophila ananassae TaxID=7217 RepID=UPI001CFF750B|nr:uncharacterized protein LOC123258266 [Drosophila ananassae]